MTDLECARCGIVRSHADASIEDLHRTCEERVTFETPEGPIESTIEAKHEWRAVGRGE